MMRWIVVGGVELMIVAVSWKALLKPGSHGFYRFFVFEILLGLLVLNMNSWFYRPLAWNQIISWTLLAVCVIPLVLGVNSLRQREAPTKQRKGDSTLLAFEKTAKLVTTGIYHFIRHPLYTSLLLLAWGIFFKSPSLFGSLLALSTSLFLIATARADETECIQFFGGQYRDYMNKTKMFIPYVF